MISLIRFQGELFPRLDHFTLHLLYFGGEYDFCGCCRVNARSFDGDDDVSSVLEEVMSIQSDDTCLIWLGDIGENDIDHGYEHAVLHGVTGVLDDGDDVCAPTCHADEITS